MVESNQTNWDEKLKEFAWCVGKIAIQEFLLSNLTNVVIESAKAFWRIYFLQQPEDQLGLCQKAGAMSESERQMLATSLAEGVAQQASSSPQSTVHTQQVIGQALDALAHIAKPKDRQSVRQSIEQHICQGTQLPKEFGEMPISPTQSLLGSCWLGSLAAAPLKGTQHQSSNLPQVKGYTIGKEIGRGASAAVFMARDPHDKVCALKIGRLQGAKRFARELEALRQIRHPRLVAYYDGGIISDGRGDYFWLAMEYVSPYTLRDLLSTQKLQVKTALLILAQILQALTVLHQEAHLVHRDLKPENILLDVETFALKLTDFGLVKTTDEQSGSLSATGDLIGTPLYMSPEQVDGNDTTTAADIWAAGVILWEMVVGSVPFYGKTIMSLGKAILTHEPDWRKLPGELRPIVRQFLCKTPGQRPADGKAALALLEQKASKHLTQLRIETQKAVWQHLADQQLLQKFAAQHGGIWNEQRLTEFYACYPQVQLQMLPEDVLREILQQTFAVEKERLEVSGQIAQARAKLQSEAVSMRARDIQTIGQQLEELDQQASSVEDKIHKQIPERIAGQMAALGQKKKTLTQWRPVIKVGILIGMILCVVAWLVIPETVETPRLANQQRPVETSSDGRYHKYMSGVILDTKTELEWFVGPDKNTTWDEAKSWTDRLTLEGGGWRMPTIEELRGLYQKGKGSRNMDPVFVTAGFWIWSCEQRDGSSAWPVCFGLGSGYWSFRNTSDNHRAFAVRPGRRG